MNGNCVILGAGFGSRMNSTLPKILLDVCFYPMIGWVTKSAYEIGLKKEDIAFVLGYKRDLVQDFLEEKGSFFYQEEQLGTAHGVMCALPFLSSRLQEDTLVLYGDAPFIDSHTLKESYALHKQKKNSCTLITAQLDNPYGYGRIIKENGVLQKIVEEKDATEEEKKVKEINSGFYWFSTKDLVEVLPKITNQNAQKEFYLTDAVTLLKGEGKPCGTFMAPSPHLVMGANTKEDLRNLNQIGQKLLARKWEEKGVEIIDPTHTYLSPLVSIGKGTTLYPGVVLKGNTTLGSCVTLQGHIQLDSVTLGAFTSLIGDCVLSHTSVGEGCTIKSSYLMDSVVKDHVTIGPFAQIRPNSIIENEVKIGNFVEVKNSTLGEKTSIAHLTYIGDSDFGKEINVGCGVVTVNYDGKNKFRTTVKDKAFIGCNTNLIAPVTIGEGGYTGAGSTITKSVPPYALALERSKQQTIEGWNKRKT